MKNIFLYSLLFFSFHAFATPLFDEEDCDACGCSANGGSLGFSSLLNKNFVGVRYFYQQYSSKDGLYNDSPWIKENFNTVQLWSKIPITDRIQVSAIVPFQFHNNEKTAGAQSISGFGDISLAGMYSFLNPTTEGSIFGHNLEGGVGVKLPTGKYDANINGTVNPSFQVATGSWDVFFLAEYTLAYEKWGWNTSVSYIVKNENKKKYEFGNQFNYQSLIFYTFKINETTFVPQVGVSGETYQSNKQFGETLKDTKGSIAFGKVGFEIGFKKFGVGVNALVPMNQNLTGGKVKSNYRFSVNLNYNI